MKALFLNLCILISFISNGQVTNTDGQNGLTKEELVYAKQLFGTMINSDDYVKYKKLSEEFYEKAPVKVPFDMSKVTNVRSHDDVKKIVSDWLTEYLPETKFKTVEEGVNLFMQSYDALQKSWDANAELRALVLKAKGRQRGQIFDEERKAIERKYNVSP